MADENTAQDIAAPEVPDTQAQAPAQAVQDAKPQTPQVKGPDPDKRPPFAERELNPDEFDKILNIPGAKERAAETLGVTQLKQELAAMQLESARKDVALAYGFTMDEIAEFGGSSPDEVKRIAALVAKHKPAKTDEQDAPAQHFATQPHRAVTPPSNNVPSKPMSEMTYEEITIEMAKNG